MMFVVKLEQQLLLTIYGAIYYIINIKIYDK